MKETQWYKHWSNIGYLTSNQNWCLSSNCGFYVAPASDLRHISFLLQNHLSPDIDQSASAMEININDVPCGWRQINQYFISRWTSTDILSCRPLPGLGIILIVFNDIPGRLDTSLFVNSQPNIEFCSLIRIRQTLYVSLSRWNSVNLFVIDKVNPKLE